MATSGAPGRLSGHQGLLGAMTPAQREAVLAEDPVVCVLAGAGAGKTGVLTARVARRCAEGSAPAERSIVCTFSRKAAQELRSRLYRLGAGGVDTGTIHRLALRIVSAWCEQRRKPAPVVVGDRRRLLSRLVPGDPRAVVAVDTEIGWAKGWLTGPESYEELAGRAHRVPRLPAAIVADLYGAYEAERRRRGLLDLDDLLLEATRALEQEPVVAEALRWRCAHLYVDEMQDVNRAQFALLRALCGERPDLFVVGDPDQSIYGWNGADPGLLERLPAIFPDTRVLRLDVNHRSSPAIVRCAEAVLGTARRSSAREEGPLPVVRGHESDLAEAHWVARQVWLARRGRRRWCQIAVLARTNAQLTLLSGALQAQRIPWVMASGECAPASDLEPRLGETVALTEGTSKEDRPASDGDAVVLSTFHRAKGLEWPCVFVVGLSERFVPAPWNRSAAALAEERRLLYVALTRAEEELTCSWAASLDADGTDEPCRWLALLEAERSVLEREQAPADPVSVASHLAHLRSLVNGGGAADEAQVVPLRRPGRAPR